VHFIILCIKLYEIHSYQELLCELYGNLLEEYKVIISNDYSRIFSSVFQLDVEFCH